MTKYREAFLQMEGAEKGHIHVSQLDALLCTVRRAASEHQTSKMKVELNCGDGTVFFDDWSDVMNRLVDIRAEKDLLGQLEDKGKLLRIELTACFCRYVILLLLICVYFFVSLCNMVIDVYL